MAMSGYRPGYSESHSPYFEAGTVDGERDAEIVANCPPGSPYGMDDEKSWSAMYQRGYNSIARVPHVHGPGCDQWKREQARLRQEQQRREQQQREQEQRIAANKEG